MVKRAAPISIELPHALSGTELADLCEAAETAIIDGGGFGWLKPPPIKTLEAFWNGVLLVPDKTLFVAPRARGRGRVSFLLENKGSRLQIWMFERHKRQLSAFISHLIILAGGKTKTMQ